MAAAPDEFAPAKINLTLHIGRRRADGYHQLESLVVFADAGDKLRFAAANDLSLSVNGPFAAALTGETDNLVLKAARALAAQAKIEPRAHIRLTKNLPIASGIGGGSADAAAALRGLMRLWNLNVAPAALQRIALSLGADVPACLHGGALQVEGVGERLMPLPGFPVLDAVLVNPGVAVSTAEVFRRLDIRTGITHNTAPHDWSQLLGFLEQQHNDLEEPASHAAPIIREAIDALCADPLSLLVRMSGSGATCFGIYGDAGCANDAARMIAKAHPDWWVKAVKLNYPPLR
ncbi:MAG TPA: 4-(cytidine 5'-diphospho)-2-C-methyl-D-erythritol kinase [Rhizomicrobium sp.]|nr:4-(cytidine 5'-diphospho)-2-C-methyl-D-erythritol kinase [Rhizomicrobium sp.]